VGAGTVEAEDAPRAISREVFDLDAGKGGVAAQDLACRTGAFGFGIHKYIFATLKDAQVCLDSAFRVQECRVDTEVRFSWHLVGEDGVEHLYRVSAGEPEHGPVGAVHEARSLFEGLVPGARVAVTGGVRRAGAKILP
jgi:hypothetical protein